MVGIYQFTTGHSLVLSGDCELGGPIQHWTLWGPEFPHDPSDPKGGICYHPDEPEMNSHPSDAESHEMGDGLVARLELATEAVDGRCERCGHEWVEHNINYSRGVECGGHWDDDGSCACRRMPAIPTEVLRPLFGLDRNPAADSSVATETEAT